MILTVEEGVNALRIYNDDGANTVIVEQLIEALPSYINTLTGYYIGHMMPDDDPANCDPLIKTLGKFILQLWYNPDGTDAAQLQRVIESLAKTVKARGNTQYAISAQPKPSEPEYAEIG